MQVMKRIPKGARPAAANLLQKLIRDVLRCQTSPSAWSRLFGFPAACLAKPRRCGKSHNLTTSIVKQIRQYELGAEPDPEPVIRRPAQRNKPARTQEETIAAMASAKLEDGDVKGAVRLLCSDDTLAPTTAETFTKLSPFHPPAPADRRPAPTTDMPPLQVSPAAAVTAAEFSAGPDGLRPQHLKDLLAGSTDDSLLLMAVTGLTNILLRGVTRRQSAKLDFVRI